MLYISENHSLCQQYFHLQTKRSSLPPSTHRNIPKTPPNPYGFVSFFSSRHLPLIITRNIPYSIKKNYLSLTQQSSFTLLLNQPFLLTPSFLPLPLYPTEILHFVFVYVILYDSHASRSLLTDKTKALDLGQNSLHRRIYILRDLESRVVHKTFTILLHTKAFLDSLRVIA